MKDYAAGNCPIFQERLSSLPAYTGKNRHIINKNRRITFRYKK